MIRNKLDSEFQSAYKARHSTETALTRVHDDIMRAVDSQGGAILVLLDLSAAFDTIDHELLIDALQSNFGVVDKALAWFRSYLENRHQKVVVNDSCSALKPLKCGVPQGSVVGPLLFSVYTQPLCALVDTFGLDKHMYADDTQNYAAFSPKSKASVNKTFKLLQDCTLAIKQWMTSHYLKLNAEKTEVLVITTPTTAKELVLPPVCIASTEIIPKECIRDLGFLFDNLMKMEHHTNSVCKAAYYNLHKIFRIRRFLSSAAAKTLVHWTVTSRLDYCNGLLFGVSDTLLKKYQRIQNTAARLVTGASRDSHITPQLIELHWLPVPYRVKFKIIMTTFKALNGLAPQYLRSQLQYYTPGRQLRSADHNLLVEPKYRLETFGARAFSNAAPRLWNSLPGHMRSIDSVQTFITAKNTLVQGSI